MEETRFMIYLPKSKDEKVLIVDDICDSGETFERLSEYIKENINHECDVRFVSLWWNNECDFEPHYYIRDLAKDTNEICALIEKDDFVPDVIVGISRGGLIPGVMISHKLNIPFKPVHASTRDFPHESWWKQ